jgi:hypothetical protein
MLGQMKIIRDELADFFADPEGSPCGESRIFSTHSFVSFGALITRLAGGGLRAMFLGSRRPPPAW